MESISESRTMLGFEMEALTHKSDITRANTARTMSQQHTLHKSSSVPC